MPPDRKDTRLPGLDYTSGMFFVTICTYQRQPIFGTINAGQSQLSPLGYVALDQWQRLGKNFSNVRLDTSIVMPNHIHGLVLIKRTSFPDRNPESSICKDLSSLVGSFKSAVSREGRRLQVHHTGLVWQTSFYDHQVRHERALERIREYIAGNPKQWGLDRENPQRTGIGEFYRWLESYKTKLAVKPDSC